MRAAISRIDTAPCTSIAALTWATRRGPSIMHPVANLSVITMLSKRRGPQQSRELAPLPDIAITLRANLSAPPDTT